MESNHNHIFYTDDNLMKEMGLSRFTLEELREYCNAYGKNPKDLDFITDGGNEPNGDALFKALTAKGNLAQRPALLAWDADLDSYKYREITEYRFLFGSAAAAQDPLVSVIDTNRRYLKTKYKDKRDTEDYYSGLSYDHNKNTKFINQINTSSSGCITYQPELKYFSSYPSGQSITFKPLIRLYLRDPKQDLAPKNEMALKTPIISDIPETKAGTPYGFSVTKFYESKDGIASLRPPVNGDYENLDNKVAGYLDTYFNENTGMFEAGTKLMLVRLLADLPAVESLGVDVESIDDSSYNDFFGGNAEQNQAGNFSVETHTVEALCLYLHNGNKRFFGPMFVDKRNKTNKKEKILVTNRTPSNFSVNEIVFVAEIDGEWVPLKLGSGSGGSASAKVENWSFTKLIANSDSYFRDDRYYRTLNIYGNTDNIPSYARGVISPESYTQKIRNKYYKDLYSINQQIALLNIEQSVLDEPSQYDIAPSKRYIQSTVFDQLGSFMGGKNEKNLIARCNFDNAPDGSLYDPNDPYDENFLGFWGPQFIDGYKSNEVQNLLSKKDSLVMNLAGGDPTSFFSPYAASPSAPAVTDIGAGSRNVSLSYASPKGMFGDGLDKVAKNLPAEVATNAPITPKGMGSPVEDIRFTISALDPSNNMVNATKDLLTKNALGFQNRFNWLYQPASDSGILNPVYNLTPINPARVDFFSLTAEMVSSTDYQGSIGNVRNHGNPVLMDTYFSTPTYGNHLFGGDFFFNRNSFFEDMFSTGFRKHGTSGPTGPVIKVIPYDKYVLRKSTGDVGDIFLPNFWEDETGDAVGVISARCRLRLSGTNQIKLKCTQQFGLPVRNWFLGVTPRQDARWGGFSDRPQDFNTTALHVKVYDSWPAEQTIFDSRYFSVFHFNPGVEKPADTETTPVTVGSLTYYPDKITETVDFREPTFANNTLMGLGTFDSSTSMAPIQSWRVNTSSRGKMLTLGGYRHIRKVSGVDPSSVNILYGGKNYVVGDKLIGSGGGQKIEFEVTAIGITGNITAINVVDKGINLLASELSTLRLIGGSGTECDIKFLNGLIYERIFTDLGPQERVTTTSLTDPSNQGKGNNEDWTVTGIKQQLLLIEEPNSTGKYDLFFHYHNDITHTVQSTRSSGSMRSKVQRVLLEITVE